MKEGFFLPQTLLKAFFQNNTELSLRGIWLDPCPTTYYYILIAYLNFYLVTIKIGQFQCL